MKDAKIMASAACQDQQRLKIFFQAAFWINLKPVSNGNSDQFIRSGIWCSLFFDIVLTNADARLLLSLRLARGFSSSADNDVFQLNNRAVAFISSDLRDL